MCGIVGIYNPLHGLSPETDLLEHMLTLIHHRGPDETGLYLDDYVGMGSARLSIVDLVTGQQPLSNEDGTLWIVFNGEIFNYVELMSELKSRGHIFRSSSDTEVIIHLYEEFGVDALPKLNGQFAFAIWDARRQELLLARDRVGICPLFYTQTASALIFASEIKALLLHPDVTAQIDTTALDQIFTCWTALAPRTIFRDIVELPPGHYLQASPSGCAVHPYWQLDFSREETKPLSVEDALAEFEALLSDAVRLRLRADVPVAAYLSGGLDSSTTAELILRTTHSDLNTFSIGFTDPDFDETRYQNQAAAFLGTKHFHMTCTPADIGMIFPEVIWHTEIPILRTSPAPMHLLSHFVRQNHLKVIVTGEGADEVLGGYAIFKEALIRRFCAHQPGSRIRPLMFSQLYSWIPQFHDLSPNTLNNFFGQETADLSNPLYSHMPRWHTTARLKQFFSDETQQQIGKYRFEADVRAQLPPEFTTWSPLAQTQFLETSIFMSHYLLSSQGDRMTMANSVEGRYPFLDHRVIEFCAKLPPAFKIRGLKEKYLLKRMMQKRLPEAIIHRPKQPYRAPIRESFIGENSPEYVRDLLSETAVESAGLFSKEAVNRLVNKVNSGHPLSETDGMALVGILSTQLVHETFIRQFKACADVPVQPVSHVVTPNYHYARI
jgi:asparagine synthase (glutamine-hydrolysing)